MPHLRAEPRSYAGILPVRAPARCGRLRAPAPGFTAGQAPGRSLARRAGHRHPLPAVQEAAHFALAVAAVAAGGADRRQLAATRPPRHGLRVHPEHGCNLGWCEQAVLRLDLGSHGTGPLTLEGSWSVTESNCSLALLTESALSQDVMPPRLLQAFCLARG